MGNEVFVIFLQWESDPIGTITTIISSNGERKMNFKLMNFGRVRDAGIRLDGITVIAGPNGSGKSTISRALFTWYTFLHQVEKEILQERADIISEDIESVLKQNGVPSFIASRFRPLYFRNRLPLRFVDLSFWMNEGEALEWLSNRIHRIWPRFSAPDGDNNNDLRKICALIRKRVIEHLEMEKSKLEKFILERYFLRAFDGQIGSLFDKNSTSLLMLSGSSEISPQCTFKDGKVSELLDAQSTIIDEAYGNMRMFYLEPKHLLDEISVGIDVRRHRLNKNRYSVQPDLDWNEILTKTLDRQAMLFVQAERMSPILEELDKIVLAIHGEIDRVDRALVFKDADVSGDNAISLRNIASGTKSIAAIVRGIRNDSIRPGDFLIIDEPESNLHPEWQLLFAKFLVLLHARFDMRILLNTHSPYFLKAIETYSDLLEQGDDCEYYNMVSKDHHQYEAVRVTGNLQDIFKSMSAPFSRLLNGDHYERTVS